MHYQSSLFKSKSEWEKPTVADKVVEWAGVVGKHISWEIKNTIVGGWKTLNENCRENKGWHARQSSGLSASDVQHISTPCLFCLYTCRLTLHFCKRNPWEAKSRTKHGTKTMLTCWKLKRGIEKSSEWTQEFWPRPTDSTTGMAGQCQYFPSQLCCSYSRCSELG